jgi:uncharacterized protein YjgD (DUF1641 family)
MAVAVDFRTYKPQNSRDDLIRRIEAAPQEHAQAVLAAYELLENLHQKGILDILNGMLRAGETVVNQVASIISSKQAVSAVRAELMMMNLLSTIDVDQLSKVLADASKEPPSLIGIIKLANTEDARRAMATGLGLLNLFGAALNAQKPKKHG